MTASLMSRSSNIQFWIATMLFVAVLCALNVFTSSRSLDTLLLWRHNASLPVEEVEVIQTRQRKEPKSSATKPGIAGNPPSNQNVYRQDPSRFKNNMNKGELDFSDPIFRRFGWDNDPIVIESHKLLFFTIPKNSCTEWKRLFRRMLNYSDWDTKDPHNPDSNGLRYLGRYKQSQQYEFMTSPNWTRAVFVRDPLQRLLSAFLDKAYSEEWYIRRHCCGNAQVKARNVNNSIFQRQCQVLGQSKKLPTPKTFPFANFVNGFMMQCSDPHWNPQAIRIRPRNWKRITFVGYFDTLQQDARRLLETIGAWNDYGATGWGPNGTLGFLERNGASHSTEAKSHQEDFYTPELLEKVYRYLKPDYDLELFHFTRPNVTGVVSS
ncbi:sulfotransferase family protein [Nitzschia inconspicua]|uniref:Sulfotransferase family protein n=1 Tax=Nitzschia inconspicua TaxID=303405 RepID=A0A9K3KR77_9STRA|nr:sulfotransferase family protein [Nitzschia inconspicua]